MVTIKLERSIDRIISVLVCFMIMSFYLFELMSWGRYVLIAITGLITVLFAIKKKGRILVGFESFHVHVFAIALFCFMSSIWAWNSALAISKGVTIMSILICYSFLYGYYRDLGSIEPLLKSIMYAGYGISLYTIIYYGLSGIISMLITSSRIGNDFTNANAIGLIAAMSIIIQFYFIIQKKANILAIFMIAAVIMLAISQSRKATVMVIVGIVFLIISSTEDQRLHKKIATILTSILVLVLMIYAISKLDIFSGVFDRFQTYFESLSGNREVNIRDVYRSIGINQFKKTPLLGIGMGNSAELLVSVGHVRTYLHDNFVEILSSGGIIGFIVYYSMYCSAGIKLL